MALLCERENRQRKLQQNYGASDSYNESLAMKYLGFKGEIAASHVLGIPWLGKQNPLGAPDLGARCEIRTVEGDGHHLLTHPQSKGGKDKESSVFFLVVCANEYPIIKGWIEGADALDLKYWREDDRPCCWIPPGDLQTGLPPGDL